MSRQPPKSDSFSSVRQYSSVYHTSEPVVAEETKERAVVGNTRQDQNRDLIMDLFQMRDRECFIHQEISFQKNFLAQHIKALDGILQKLEESMPPTSQSFKKNPPRPSFPKEALQIDKSNLIVALQSLEPGCCEMCHDEFISDLQRQADLEGFLGHIVEKCSKQLVTCLLIISIDTWVQVRNHTLKQFEIPDFRRMAIMKTNQKAPSYFKQAHFRPLTGLSETSQNSPTSGQTFQQFKGALKRFVTTILLIAGGFFQNPYAENSSIKENQGDVDYPKRQSSSVSISFLSQDQFFSDSEDEPEPEKKLKTQ